MNSIIIQAFKALEDIDDDAVVVRPKQKLKESKEPLKESSEDYYVLSDGANARKSTVFSSIDNLDEFIAKLESDKGDSYWELLHYVNGNPKKIWSTKDGRIEESCELKEEPTFELSPDYDSRQSFYGKAKVDVRPDGTQVLYSYGTPVCMIKDGKATLLKRGYLGWASSQTTLRHVKEFLKQNGFEANSINDLRTKYEVKQFDESLGESCSDKELVDKLVAFGSCENEDEARERVSKMSQEDKISMCKSLDHQAKDHLLNDSLNESKLNENELVNLSNKDEVEKAKEKIEKEEVKDENEYIVDVDAETVDKLKDSYVGDVILICRKCRTPMYKHPEDLKKDEEAGFYNLEDECSHCGALQGYELGGQVGEFATDEQAEEASKDEVEKEDEKADVEVEKKVTTIEDEDEFSKVESFDDSKFNTLVSKYLKEVYENVDSFETKDGSFEDDKVVIDGTIKYTNEKTKDVKFVFENISKTKGNKYKLVGVNEELTNDKDAFSVIATIKDDALVCESFAYNYKVSLNEEETLVRGRTSLRESKKAKKEEK